MAKKSKYTDDEWRALIPTDAEERALISDVEICRRAGVESRATVLCVRRRLGIASFKARTRETLGPRTNFITFGINDEELAQLKTYVKESGLSRGAFLRSLLGFTDFVPNLPQDD